MFLLLACNAPLGEGGAVPGDVVINEIVVRNQSTWDDGTYTFPDWIELYNGSDTPVPLAWLALSDGGDLAWQGGEGTLQPGARLLVPADGGPAPAHAPFRLAADELLTLTVSGVVRDRLRVGEPGPDVAWARHPDGGPWAQTVWSTPDRANLDTPSPTLDVSDTAFGTGTVHTAELELSDAATESLRSDRFGWVEGAVTLDGIRYAPVAVRLKSQFGSRRELDQKPGFKIDLDEYADFRWRGLDALTLNNMVQDPTFVREHLAYTLFRAMGVPAPRVGWMHVSLNDEDHGLSLLVETADDDFLGRWYSNVDGALYEGSSGTDLHPGMEARYEYDQGPDPDDRSDLTAVIDVLSGTPDDATLAELGELVDLDEVRAFLAGESLTLHWDGYNYGNNYRLYHDPASDRFSALPWGTDEAFQRIDADPWSGNGWLLRFCVANAGCRAAYDDALLRAVNLVGVLDLEGEAERVAAWLRTEIAADPKKECDMERHDAELERTRQLLASWPEQVRGMLEDGGLDTGP